MTFKSLVSAVSEQCQEIKQSLALLPYFETWEPELIAEFCRVSLVMVFPPEEIILGPDTRDSHEVYFILEGVCRMLEKLLIVVTKKSHKKAVYKLQKYSHSKAINFELKNEGYMSRSFNQNHRFQKPAEASNGNYYENTNSCEISKRFANNDSKRVKENLSESDHRILNLHAEATRNSTVVDENIKVKNNNTSNLSSSQNPDNQESVEGISEKEDNSGIRLLERKNLEHLFELEEEKIQGSVSTWKAKQEFGNHLDVLDECKKRREDIFRAIKKTAPPEKPKNTKCFFIQTGFLLKGACFGLEKSEKEIFIISTTAVKCLKIPLRFLLRHNPCNIWNRIRLFHSLYFPKEEKVFEYFQSDRRWMEKKKMQTLEIVSLKKFPLFTSLSDVPYSIRLNESQLFI